MWQTADENDSDLRYSEVPLKGKNKTLVKILGGRQHRSNNGGSRPLQPLWVDAYGRGMIPRLPFVHFLPLRPGSSLPQSDHRQIQLYIG